MKATKAKGRPGRKRIYSSGAEKARAWASKQSDIGAVPAVADPKRRERCKNDLPLFLRTYMPSVYSRPFSPAHERFLDDLVFCMLHDGKKCAALPRGAGKSSLCIGAILWASLYAHRRFLVLIAATEPLAVAMVNDIKAQLESELIAADFPEVCFPISALEGKTQRCKSQTSDGEPTNIEMKKECIVFATVKGNENAGVVIQACGITGAVRGIHRVDSQKRWVRPDFVLLDDPQTRESAESVSQTDTREAIVLGDVLGLAGHDRNIAAVMACTVITKGDLSERFLDNKKHPEWRGQREKMVDGWGEDESIFAEYDEAYRLEAEGARPVGYANEMWQKLELDKKCTARVMDTNLYAVTEVSALQHARNKRLEMGEGAFLAECNNDPPSTRPDAEYDLDARMVAMSLNHHRRGAIPANAVSLVASVDINKYAAAWTVMCATSASDYEVIDYGWWLPKWKKMLWNGDENIDRAVMDAVNGIAHDLLEHSSYGDKIDALCIDAGFSSSAVYSQVSILQRLYKHRRIIPARGLAGDKYGEPTKAQRIRVGDLCDYRKTQSCPNGVMMFDSHHWHMVTQRGFLMTVGSEGSVSVYGDTPTVHATFAEQVAAEKLVRTWLNPYGKRVAEFATNGRNEQSDTVAMCGALLSCEGFGVSSMPKHSRITKAREAAETVKEDPKPQEPVKAADEPVEEVKTPPQPPQMRRRPSIFGNHKRGGGSWCNHW